MDIDWNSENKIAQSAFYETMQFNFAIQMLNVFYLEFEIYVEMIGANMKKVDNLCSAGTRNFRPSMGEIKTIFITNHGLKPQEE